MLNVTEEQIEAYNSNSIHKELIIKFPQFMGNNPFISRNIISESMTLKEMILDGKNVEFVGCNSSEFTIKLKNVWFDAKGTRIEVSIKTDDTDPIPLFKGTVYSAKRDVNTDIKEIKAYDKLYEIGQYDLASWYNTLPFPITLKQFRERLFQELNRDDEGKKHYDIECVEATLPNDNITIDKQYDPKTLKCLSVLKAICQINGCFGIINRDEKFEFRFLPHSTGRQPANVFEFAKKVRKEDFSVSDFNCVVIRDNDQDRGEIAGDYKYYSLANKYIIQANMFTYKLDNATKQIMAQNVFDTIKDIYFTPVETDNNGLPFIEVGDVVEYNVGSGRSLDSKYLVLNRELNGIQALRDKYGADGDEEADGYVTDLQTQIDTIKQSGGGGGTPEDVYTKEETDERIEEMIEEKSFKVVSCTILPEKRDAETIYLVQGDFYSN